MLISRACVVQTTSLASAKAMAYCRPITLEVDRGAFIFSSANLGGYQPKPFIADNVLDQGTRIYHILLIHNCDALDVPDPRNAEMALLFAYDALIAAIGGLRRSACTTDLGAG